MSCPKLFSAVKNLAAHTKTIHEVSLEKCSVCDKSFRDTNLKRHETSCRKKYTLKIQKHYVDKKIDNAKTYSCDQGEKIFHFKSDLIAHKRHHRSS